MTGKKTICLCDDKDVQNAVKSIFMENILKKEGFEKSKNSSNKVIADFTNKAEQIFKNELKLTMDSFTTERKNEERKYVTCTAKISQDMKYDKVREFNEIAIKTFAAEDLNKNEDLTDGKFDDFIKKTYGSRSKYDKELDKQAEKMQDEIQKTRNIVNYTAKRTDDGKLIVELESK